VHEDGGVDRRLRDDEPVDSPWVDWGASSRGPLMPVESRPVASIRRRGAIAGMIAGVVALALLAALWPRRAPSRDRARVPDAEWNLELTSAGPHPVTALVFGEESGIHLVRVPASGTPDGDRRHLPVRLAAGDVYLLSLGRDELQVSTAAPSREAPIGLSARARFVTLYRTADATGVRTGWW
jgi:hypothetical protein